MHSWLDVRSTVIDNVITLDGPGNVQPNFCSSCSNDKSVPLYRCLKCSYGLLFCGECVVKLHRALPLHRLEVRSSPSPSHHTLIIHSAGRVDFSTRLLYICSDLSATLGTEVMPVPWSRILTLSSSSTSMALTNCKSSSAPVG